MAKDYLDAIHAVQPSGPYLIGGWSLGGVIAYEVAQQLISHSQSVSKLILLDTSIPERSIRSEMQNHSGQVGLEYGINLTLEELVSLSPEEQLPFLYEHAQKLGVLRDDTPEFVVQKIIDDLKRLFHHHTQLASNYQLSPLGAPILLVRPKDVPVQVVGGEDRGWGLWSPDVSVQFIPGHHHSMVPSRVREAAHSHCGNVNVNANAWCGVSLTSSSFTRKAALPTYRSSLRLFPL